MRTSKVISTISYNTKDFLYSTLVDLYSRHLISDWFFIEHEKEEDENKNHFHVFIKPNTLLDTMDLQKEFDEFDPNHPLPRRCLDFKNSNYDDAILYFVHDPKYLTFKGESRKYHYTKEDFVCADPDNFDFYWNHAYHGSDFALKNRQNTLINSSDNYAELVLSGSFDLMQTTQLLALKNLQNICGHTYRNGRKNHD